MAISRDDLLRLLREDPTLVDALRDLLFGRELKLIAEIGEQLRQVTQFLSASTREFDRRIERDTPRVPPSPGRSCDKSFNRRWQNCGKSSDSR